jgi:hypothetical protein
LASILTHAVGGGIQLQQNTDAILERIAVEHADRCCLQGRANKRLPPLETLVDEARRRVALEERLTGGISRRVEIAPDIEGVRRLVLQKEVDQQTLGLQSRSQPRSRGRFA